MEERGEGRDIARIVNYRGKERLMEGKKKEDREGESWKNKG